MGRETAFPGLLAMLLLTGAGLLGAIGLWLEQSPAQRLLQLQHLAQVEHVNALPPLLVQDQAVWLVQQRGHHLLQMTGLVGAAGLIGLVEGWLWRRHYPWRGLSVWRWRLGGLTIGLALCSAGAYLLLPWPLPPVLAAGGLGLLCGLGTYWVAAGRPHLP